MEDQMKTLNLKAVTIVGMMMAMTTAGWSRGGTPPSFKNFPEEHEAIRIDLERARQHKGEIKCLKAELKADREADRKMDIKIDKKEIEESKAKLRNARIQLRIDQQDLNESYKLATRAKKERVSLLRKAVRLAEKDLKKTMRYGNQANINRDAAYMAYINQAYLDAMNSLEEFKVERTQDMLAVKEDVREFKPQVANIIRSHDQDDYAGNCVVK
jgi:hypothetical protein